LRHRDGALQIGVECRVIDVAIEVAKVPVNGFRPGGLL
jgi:hypothetical protein